MKCSHRTDSGLPHFIAFGHSPGYNGVVLASDIIDVVSINATNERQEQKKCQSQLPQQNQESELEDCASSGA